DRAFIFMRVGKVQNDAAGHVSTSDQRATTYRSQSVRRSKASCSAICGGLSFRQPSRVATHVPKDGLAIEHTGQVGSVGGGRVERAERDVGHVDERPVLDGDGNRLALG